MALPNVNINDAHVNAHNVERAEINALRTIADALPTTYAKRSLNLADLASAATARTNLGITADADTLTIGGITLFQTDNNRLKIGDISIDWGVHQASKTGHAAGGLETFFFDHGSSYTAPALFVMAQIDNWVTGSTPLVVKQASGESAFTSEFTILNTGSGPVTYANLPVRWVTIGSV